MSRLRLGTRGSPLARWQAEHVADAIVARGGPQAELVTITTSGDRLSRAPISDVGGKRLFVKEIEEALVEGRIDLAVHSAKDLPTDRLPGLSVRAALGREDPRDVVVTPRSRPVADGDPTRLLAPGDAAPRVGTGSVRRTAQLRHAYPDLALAPIRGNVGTRLRKLDDGQFDLLVLAAAGLLRLQLGDRIAARIGFDLCMPAPGQGIVVAEYRTDDTTTAALLADLADPPTSAALAAERALVTALGADCQVPLGAITTVARGALTLRAVVASPDGATLIRQETHAPMADAEALGAEVARRLLADGAARLLATRP